MNNKYIKKEETSKKIFIENSFFSIYRSVLTLPIFNQKTNEKMLNIQIKDNSYYSNIIIKGECLNVTSDFSLFCFINLKSNINNSSEFSFDLNDYYDFIDPKKENVNNRSHIKKEVFKSLIKLRMLTVAFSIKNNSFICGFLNEGYLEENTCYVRMSSNSKNFWSADNNNIYNIEFSKIYNVLNLDYSKVLYMLLISNNIRDLNTFSIDKLKVRFTAEKMENNKFLTNLRKAIKELMEIGFIEKFEEVKEFNKTISIKIKIKEIKKTNEIKEIKKPTKIFNKILPEVLKINKDEDFPF